MEAPDGLGHDGVVQGVAGGQEIGPVVVVALNAAEVEGDAVVAGGDGGLSGRP